MSLELAAWKLGRIRERKLTAFREAREKRIKTAFTGLAIKREMADRVVMR